MRVPRKSTFASVFLSIFVSVLLTAVSAKETNRQDPRAGVALIEQQAKNYPLAVKLWTDYLIDYPRDSVALLGRAHCRAEMGQHKEAIQDYKASVEVDADNWLAHQLSGDSND